MSENDSADLGFEFVEGRRPPFTMVGDWVLLSGASHQAIRLYAIYRMHANQARGDDMVWPKRRDLAALMGFSQIRQVDRYNRELQKLEAIDIKERWVAPGVRGPNLVTVHLAPPPGYTGISSLQEFYQRKHQNSTQGGSALQRTRGSALECTGGSALQRTDNQTNPQPDEKETRQKGPARPPVEKPPGGDQHNVGAGGREEDARKILRHASSGLGTRTPGSSLAGRLITAVAAALGRGWTPTAIETALKTSLDGVKDVGRVWLTRLSNDLAGSPTDAPFGYPEPGATPEVDPELAQIRAASLARRNEQLARQAERRAAAAAFGHASGHSAERKQHA